MTDRPTPDTAVGPMRAWPVRPAAPANRAVGPIGAVDAIPITQAFLDGHPPSGA